jgi:hypothetical protein
MTHKLLAIFKPQQEPDAPSSIRPDPNRHF